MVSLDSEISTSSSSSLSERVSTLPAPNCLGSLTFYSSSLPLMDFFEAAVLSRSMIRQNGGCDGCLFFLCLAFEVEKEEAEGFVAAGALAAALERVMVVCCGWVW